MIIVSGFIFFDDKEDKTIYMKVNSGQNKTDVICRETKVTETVHRGFTVILNYISKK